MATLYLREKKPDGTVAVTPIKVEISGTGRVVNPGDPDWKDLSQAKDERKDEDNG